jgi:nicotinamidase-related amidase
MKRSAKALVLVDVFNPLDFPNARKLAPDAVRAGFAKGGASAEIAAHLRPAPTDFSVLKPRHSAFYGTPLEFLLDDLGVASLIVTGIAADLCVLYTALDAHLRNFPVWVPRDCVAAETDDWRQRALRQIERAAKGWTGPSTEPLQHGIAQAVRAAAR